MFSEFAYETVGLIPIRPVPQFPQGINQILQRKCQTLWSVKERWGTEELETNCYIFATDSHRTELNSPPPFVRTHTHTHLISNGLNRPL